MQYGLSEKNLNEMRRVFSRYKEIDEVVLYGSRAKGTFKPGSDIDLTLKGDNFNLQLRNRISLDIDELLLPYLVDISIFAQIENQDLLDHIERVGITIYKRNSRPKEEAHND